MKTLFYQFKMELATKLSLGIYKTSKLSFRFISWVISHFACSTAVLPENSLSNRFLLREIFEEFKKKFKTMENKERMKGKKSVI